MNYYQASTIPMGADSHGQPSQGLVNALRRSGFWASFLGWSTILTITGIILLAFSVSTFTQGESRSRVGPSTEQIGPGSAEDPNLMTEPTSGGPGMPAMGWLTIGLGALTLLSAIGMVIMLVWFGMATKKLLLLPTFEELHRVAVLQRRLWICIGIYSICNLIPLVISLIGAAVSISAFSSGLSSGLNDGPQ